MQTQYLVTTDRGATLIYADSPESAAQRFAQRLPKKPAAQMEYVSNYAEPFYYFKAGRTTFTIRRSFEGD